VDAERNIKGSGAVDTPKTHEASKTTLVIIGLAHQDGKAMNWQTIL